MTGRKKVEEEYLEVILELISEKGKARVSDIAGKLGISPASVTEMVQKLKKRGFVTQERYSPIKLTEKGTKIAEIVRRRHDILKAFLQLLGINDEVAERDACEIEHNVNQETVKRLTSLIEFIQHTQESQEWLKKFISFHKERILSGEEF
ncbi:metal-dependent transcriptional regulator [Candidatus Borrarchaeum sp.]|uniref:metal-dependent transcriptional regulator n=1 Tax=Candidatus Borrarchaeum sp. TaxID=2846742 RepID=UPI00257C7187|nr:iron dependent repressor, metal binding and dimerization domain protein [Candidatus Borrarchaeum sp.]